MCVGTCTHSPVCMWRPEGSQCQSSPHFPPCLRSGVLICGRPGQAGWSRRFQGFSWLTVGTLGSQAFAISALKIRTQALTLVPQTLLYTKPSHQTSFITSFSTVPYPTFSLAIGTTPVASSAPPTVAMPVPILRTHLLFIPHLHPLWPGFLPVLLGLA